MQLSFIKADSYIVFLGKDVSFLQLHRKTGFGSRNIEKGGKQNEGKRNSRDFN